MFDRFTDGARKAMFRSRRAALRRAVEERALPGRRAVEAPFLPFTPRAKGAIEGAMAIARGLGDDHLGCEHLVLGLLAEREGIAGRALERFVTFLPLQEAALESRRPPGPVEKLIQAYPSIEDAAIDWARDLASVGDAAQGMLVAAGRVAHELGHDFLDGEHVLLGMLDAGDSMAVRALAKLGIEASAVRAETERRMAPEAARPLGPVFAGRLKRILHLASQETRDEELIAAEHILLGLLAEREGVAARALTTLGLDLERLRTAVAAAGGGGGRRGKLRLR